MGPPPVAIHASSNIHGNTTLGKLVSRRARAALGGPPHERERIFPHLQLVPMPPGSAFYECGDVRPHVYFPTDATVSVLYVMSDGAAAEISVVGNDASCVVMNSCFVDDRHEDAEARLWPQTERIKASCKAAEATGAFISRPSELSRREVTRWDPRVQGEAGTLAVPVLHRPSLFRTWTGLRECQARSTCRAKRSRCSSRTSVNLSPVAAAIALSTGCRGSAGMRS